MLGVRMHRMHVMGLRFVINPTYLDITHVKNILLVWSPRETAKTSNQKEVDESHPQF